MKSPYLIVSLALALFVATPAHSTDPSPVALAQRLDAELSQLVEVAHREGTAIDTPALDRIQRELDAGGVEWVRRGGEQSATSKLDQIRSLLGNARRYNELRTDRHAADMPYAEQIPAVMMRISASDNQGASCESALDLKRDGAVALTLTPSGSFGDAFWIRVPASMSAPTAISTLGSRGDVDIAIYADCADDQPAVTNDDFFGLQAVADVPANGKASYLARIGNRDASRPVPARIEVVLATGFSGKVSTNPAGTASLAGIIVAYFSASNDYYLGTVQTDGNGVYTVPMAQGGTFYARTGAYYSSSSQSPLIHEAYGGVVCSNPDYYYLSTCAGGTLAAIVVAENQYTTGIDFELGLGRALVFSLVSDADGSPVTGATATISGPGVNYNSVYADSAGRVTVRGLLTGVAYYASFNADGFRREAFDNIPCPSYCQSGQGTAITFQPGDPYYREQVVGLAPSHRLSVYVRDLPNSSYYASVSLLFASGQVALSDYAYYTSSIPGWRKVTFVDPPAGSYYLQAGYYDSSFWRLYPNVDCLTNCTSLLGQAQAIVVSDSAGSQEYFIDPLPFPSVHGHVVDSVSGAPVTTGAVANLIALPGSGARTASVDALGDYRLDYVRPGTYLVAITSNQHIDVAFPNAPCTYVNYNLLCPTAAPVTIAATPSSVAYDFSLLRSGRIDGRLTIEGAPVSATMQMRLKRADGSSVQSALQLSAGRYSLSDVDPGIYRAIIEDSNIAFGQVYPGIDCAGSACLSETRGETLNLGQTALTDVDFNLRLQRGAKGRVISEVTGQPLSGVVVDMWGVTSWGESVYARSGMTGADGRFAIPAVDTYVSDYRLATFVGEGYVNEVYNSVECPIGPAYLNFCDLMQGDTIPALHTVSAQGISFRLRPTGTDSLFRDGMED